MSNELIRKSDVLELIEQTETNDGKIYAELLKSMVKDMQPNEIKIIVEGKIVVEGDEKK